MRPYSARDVSLDFGMKSFGDQSLRRRHEKRRSSKPTAKNGRVVNLEIANYCIV